MAKTKASPVDEWLEADGLILLESWARDGYTVNDIATRVGVTVSSLRSWMSHYPEIKQAINAGRELVDYKVENALLKAALGYKTREVKVSARMVHGKMVDYHKETIDKEFAPSVSACQVWLYNRKPKTWKNMNSKANILDEIDEDTSIHITVERASNKECQNNNTDTMATIDEVDVDWQNDVNDNITLRKATKQEQAANKSKGPNVEKKSPTSDTTSSAKESKKVSARKSNATQPHTPTDTKAIHDDSDLDYWPDDWEDEEA